ncbi:DUF1559 domain-containing protein [uncultured Gimesia sp.]|uniref:DUF1559 family PulG-like putative transporter n=1 Tax=uncultured Gimesia sp. TaxID=1678688 RepID=UPI0026394574|nr:DUF1559 domain-containing protein [uncultured Gimesia sp.]
MSIIVRHKQSSIHHQHPVLAILLAGTVSLLTLAGGCKKDQTADTQAAKTPAAKTPDENSSPKPAASTDKTSTTSRNKPIDPSMIITPGKRMKVERYKNVKQKLNTIGFAFHTYQNKNGPCFMPDPETYPQYYDKNGRLKVSWKVHLLPYLDQKPLYERFKLDEPWDSPNNAPLAKNMPDIFRSPDTPSNSDLTRFHVFEGQWAPNSKGKKKPTTVFPLGKATSFRDITDGASNTVMLVEVGADQAVKWTKPDGLDEKLPLEAMGNTAEGVPALFVDGSVQCVMKNAGDDMWKKLIRPDDGVRVEWHKFIIVHTSLSPEQLRQLNNIKEITLAFHNYLDKFRSFPPAKEHLTNGKSLLSWRVHLLPFLGEAALYKEFHLNEPWDSPQNKGLIKKMPKVFKLDPGTKPGETQFMTFSGEKTPFTGGPGVGLRDVTDGFSNTIMLIKAAPDKAVPWTKPVDLVFDPVDPIKPTGQHSSPAFIAVMMDGSIRYVPTNIPVKELKNLIQHNDGNLIRVDLKRVSLL